MATNIQVLCMMSKSKPITNNATYPRNIVFIQRDSNLGTRANNLQIIFMILIRSERVILVIQIIS